VIDPQGEAQVHTWMTHQCERRNVQCTLLTSENVSDQIFSVSRKGIHDK